MSLPFTLPNWLPWWLPLIVLLPLLLYLLVFLLMPFSVFGLKGRLEAIEVRLDDLSQEIRHLSAGLSSSLPTAAFDEQAYETDAVLARERPLPQAEAVRVPVAPPPSARPAAVANPARRPDRIEPRLDFPP